MTTASPEVSTKNIRSPKKKIVTKLPPSIAKEAARRNVPPVAPKNHDGFDAASQRIGHDVRAQIALEGPAEIDVDDIEVISVPRFKDKAETEAFMAQLLTILIYPSAEKFPEDPVQLGVNGRNAFVWRNKPTVIKRMYVERLARARNEGITQDPANPDPKIANQLTKTQGLRYPFQVLKDPHPMGSAWLQALLAQTL